MGPVFIRRGKVLFLLKSPEDFFRSLRSGKVQPTDCILVKDRAGMEWIPIGEVDHFRLETSSYSKAVGEVAVLSPGDLFDHVRQPRFNFSALALGGFWYFFHSMPRLAVKRLALATVTASALLSVGVFLELSFIQIVPFLILGWFGTATLSALRADHDLNRLQVERFHQGSPQPDVSLNGSDQAPDPTADPEDLHIPTLKEKVLN